MGKMNGRGKRKRGGYDPSVGRPNKLIKTEAKGLRVIHEKLGNSTIGEFLPALHSLGALAGDGSEATSAILQFGGGSELVHQLLPFLNHQDNSVQLAAVGALRNLSSCGNEGHIKQLLQCGVLEPLCLLLNKGCNATDAVQLSEQHAVLEQAAYILYNLCELSAEATEAASVEAVSALLQPALPAFALLAVHTALLCLTEDNPKACAAVECHSEQLEQIVSGYSADTDTDGLALHDAVTVAGILTNLGKCDVRSPILTSVMSLISHALSLTPAALLQQYVVPPTSSPNETAKTTTTTLTDEVASPGSALEELDRISIQGASNGGSDPAAEGRDGMDQEEGEEGSTPEADAAAKELVMHLEHHAMNKDGVASQDTGAVTAAAWAKLQHFLGAQQIALELLNNLCCGEDDESCDEASGIMKQKGVVKWTEEESFMNEGDEDEWEHTDNIMDLEEVLQPLLQQHNVFDRVLEVLQPVDPTVLQVLPGSKYSSQLQALLSGVRARGLATLQAVIECQDADKLGGPARLFQCWTDIARLAFQEAKFEGEEELEGATGTLRALIAKFGPEDSHHLAAITQQDLKVLLSAGSRCGGAGARRNLSRLVGLLGCLLLGGSSASSLIQEPVKGIMTEATDFLLLLAGTDQSLLVSAEALDVVMDLYAEDNTDRLALETRLLDRLPQILDYFNARYKRARRDEALMQHRVLFVTVKENLPEFIKYKMPRVKNVDSEKKHPKKEPPAGGKGKGKGGEANKNSKKERRK